MSTTDVCSCIFCPPDSPTWELYGGLLRRCLQCGFHFSPSAIDEEYDAAYFAGGGYEDYFVPTARRYEANIRLNWLAQYFPEPGMLVEAGSAAGFFVAEALQRGWDARGVEFAGPAAEYAVGTVGVPVIHGSFEDVPVTGPMDVVCAFHVLEHVSDPFQFLAATRNWLTESGLLFVEVPNIDSPIASAQGLDWPGLQPEYHRWHFGPTTLKRLLDAAGFEVLALDTVTFRSYMPRRYRLRHGWAWAARDIRALHSLRLTDPTRADLLRVVAQPRRSL